MTISYAQRYEDLHLMRCFGAQAAGFYIDVGAGHPVYDNVSFGFYLRGWNGITVEPNAWLAQLSSAVRPRDLRVQALVGATEGVARYYLIEHFHGLSTTIESNARAAQQEYGKAVQAIPVEMTTLAKLCAQHAPATIDFLKIDVEGAEQEVLSGNDWTRFRPKVVVAEALAPLTLRPVWDTWEPVLLAQGYRFAFFDSLNRYYVAEEQADLAARLADEPAAFENVVRFASFGAAAEDRTHPDHRLAELLLDTDMVRLPLLPADEIVARLTAGLAAADLQSPATEALVAIVHDRLFGGAPSPEWTASLNLSRDATIRDLYRCAVDTAAFRAASGRISASSAW